MKRRTPVLIADLLRIMETIYRGTDNLTPRRYQDLFEFIGKGCFSRCTPSIDGNFDRMGVIKSKNSCGKASQDLPAFRRNARMLLHGCVFPCAEFKKPDRENTQKVVQMKSAFIPFRSSSPPFPKKRLISRCLSHRYRSHGRRFRCNRISAEGFESDTVCHRESAGHTS